MTEIGTYPDVKFAELTTGTIFVKCRRFKAANVVPASQFCLNPMLSAASDLMVPSRNDVILLVASRVPAEASPKPPGAPPAHSRMDYVGFDIDIVIPRGSFRHPTFYLGIRGSDWHAACLDMLRAVASHEHVLQSRQRPDRLWFGQRPLLETSSHAYCQACY